MYIGVPIWLIIKKHNQGKLFFMKKYIHPVHVKFSFICSAMYIHNRIKFQGTN